MAYRLSKDYSEQGAHADEMILQLVAIGMALSHGNVNAMM